MDTSKDVAQVTGAAEPVGESHPPIELTESRPAAAEAAAAPPTNPAPAPATATSSGPFSADPSRCRFLPSPAAAAAPPTPAAVASPPTPAAAGATGRDIEAGRGPQARRRDSRRGQRTGLATPGAADRDAARDRAARRRAPGWRRRSGRFAMLAALTALAAGIGGALGAIGFATASKMTAPAPAPAQQRTAVADEIKAENQGAARIRGADARRRQSRHRQCRGTEGDSRKRRQVERRTVRQGK